MAITPHSEENSDCQCIQCIADREFLQRYQAKYEHYMHYFHPDFLAALEEERGRSSMDHFGDAE